VKIQVDLHAKEFTSVHGEDATIEGGVN